MTSSKTNPLSADSPTNSAAGDLPAGGNRWAGATSDGSRWSPSVITRFIALLVIPIIAIGFLTTQRITDLAHQHEAWSRCASYVRLQDGIAGLSTAINVESSILVALATLDQFGLERGNVEQLVGFDGESISRQAIIDTDEALRELETLTTQLPNLLDTDLDILLPVWQDSLDGVRAALGRRDADPAQVQAVYQDVLVPLYVELDRSIHHRVDVTDVVVLRDLQSVIRTSHEPTLAVLDQLRTGKPDLAALAAVRAAHLSQLLRLEQSAPDEFLLQIRQLKDNLPDVPSELPVASVGTSLTNDQISNGAALIGQRLAYETAVRELSGAMHMELATDAEELARDIHHRILRTGILAVAIISAIVMLLLFIAADMVSSLRRLHQRATQIARGNLAATPIKPTGPREIREVATAMNDMQLTLSQLERVVDHLSKGPLILSATGHESQDLMRRVPGSIGNVLRQAVERLSVTLTSLYDNEATWISIIDSAPNPIWVVDHDDYIRHTNRAAAAITGVAVAAQIGRPLAEFLSRSQRHAVVRHTDGQRLQGTTNQSDIIGSGTRLRAFHFVTSHS